MKTILLTMLCLYSTITSAKIMSVDKSVKFVKSVNCDFSAYMINKWNQVFTPAVVCAESYNEETPRSVKPHKYCVLRTMNIFTKEYSGDELRGSPKRWEGSHCTAEILNKLIARDNAKFLYGNITGMQGGTWHVVDDKFKVFPTFHKMVEGSRGDKNKTASK